MGSLDSVKLISQPQPEKYGTVHAENYFTSCSDFSKCLWYRSKFAKPCCWVIRLRYQSHFMQRDGGRWSKPYKPHWNCRDRICDNWCATWGPEVSSSFISV